MLSLPLCVITAFFFLIFSENNRNGGTASHPSTNPRISLSNRSSSTSDNWNGTADKRTLMSEKNYQAHPFDHGNDEKIKNSLVGHMHIASSKLKAMNSSTISNTKYGKDNEAELPSSNMSMLHSKPSSSGLLQSRSSIPFPQKTLTFEGERSSVPLTLLASQGPVLPLYGYVNKEGVVSLQPRGVPDQKNKPLPGLRPLPAYEKSRTSLHPVYHQPFVKSQLHLQNHGLPHSTVKQSVLPLKQPQQSVKNLYSKLKSNLKIKRPVNANQKQLLMKLAHPVGNPVISVRSKSVPLKFLSDNSNKRTIYGGPQKPNGRVIISPNSYRAITQQSQFSTADIAHHLGIKKPQPHVKGFMTPPPSQVLARKQVMPRPLTQFSPMGSVLTESDMGDYSIDQSQAPLRSPISNHHETFGRANAIYLPVRPLETIPKATRQLARQRTSDPRIGQYPVDTFTQDFNSPSKSSGTLNKGIERPLFPQFNHLNPKDMDPRVTQFSNSANKRRTPASAGRSASLFPQLVKEFKAKLEAESSRRSNQIPGSQRFVASQDDNDGSHFIPRTIHTMITEVPVVQDENQHLRQEMERHQERPFDGRGVQSLQETSPDVRSMENNMVFQHGEDANVDTRGHTSVVNYGVPNALNKDLDRINKIYGVRNSLERPSDNSYQSMRTAPFHMINHAINPDERGKIYIVDRVSDPNVMTRSSAFYDYGKATNKFPGKGKSSQEETNDGRDPATFKGNDNEPQSEPSDSKRPANVKETSKNLEVSSEMTQKAIEQVLFERVEKKLASMLSLVEFSGGCEYFLLMFSFILIGFKIFQRTCLVI